MRIGEGNLWLGTNGGGSYRARAKAIKTHSKEQGLAAQNVYPIYQDRAGAIWIGAWPASLRKFQEGKFTNYTLKDGLPSHLTALSEDREGHLRVAGEGGIRISQYGRFIEPRGLLPKGTGMHVTHQAPDGTRRSAEQHCPFVIRGSRRRTLDRNHDGGLGRFKDGKFTRYTTHEGLFNNGVFQILEDARGNLWMSCNRGIYRVSKQESNEFAAGARRTITSVAYGRDDGMLKARDGKLWFPTQDGVAVIDPEAVPINPRPPPVMIESILVDHVPAAAGRPLRIAPDKENFEIEYAALSFINSRQIRFKYKLEGVDSGWIDAGDAALSNGNLYATEEISAETALAIDETREISYNPRPFQSRLRIGHLGESGGCSRRRSE